MTEIGRTRIARWKHDAKGAITLRFDDSMIAQAEIAVPAMIERRLTGTWFINPATEKHKANMKLWEEICPAGGQELANHTMHHSGARDRADAEYEIGACATIINAIKPAGASPLMAFSYGGGTTWLIDAEDKQRILAKYHCIFHGGKLEQFSDDCGADFAVMKRVVDAAIDEGGWRRCLIHGIGAQGPHNWIALDAGEFLKLVDYVAARRDDVWVGGMIAVYKYEKERESARVSWEVEEGETAIRVKLTGETDPALYDEPLTLTTTIPHWWTDCVVTQNGVEIRSAVDGNALRYDAIPGRGDIVACQAGVRPALKPSPKYHQKRGLDQARRQVAVIEEAHRQNPDLS